MEEAPLVDQDDHFRILCLARFEEQIVSARVAANVVPNIVAIQPAFPPEIHPFYAGLVRGSKMGLGIVFGYPEFSVDTHGVDGTRQRTGVARTAISIRRRPADEVDRR